jgi:protein-S-isoprenylcysteine O-methyltransferase Ste14
MTPDRLRRGVENAALALLYAYFFCSHLGYGYKVVPILVQEGLLAALFLARRPSKETSHHIFDWIVGVVGTFLPLTIRAGGVSFAAGPYVQLAGFAVSIAALLSLGRSIGIVAANRGIQTSGAYRVVRHPMYAGHLLCLAGYLLTFPSLRNAAIVGTTAVVILLRIVVEEALLKTYLNYYIYVTYETKYRLIPWVF